MLCWRASFKLGMVRGRGSKVIAKRVNSHEGCPFMCSQVIFTSSSKGRNKIVLKQF